MKKFFKTIMIATLFMGFQSSLKAQKPILPYGDHPKDSIKKFAISNTPLANSWRENLLSYLNAELAFQGYTVNLTSHHIAWILDSTEIVERRIKSFFNSSRYGDVVKFDKLLDHDFEGMVGVFHFKGLQIIIFKANCLNLLRVEKEKTQQTIPVIAEPAKKEEKKDTPKVETKKVEAEEYIPDPTPYVASSKPEAKKMEMGDEVEDKGTWTHIPKRNYYEPERPRVRLSIGINFGPRQPYYGGQTFNPIPGDRHDPPVLGGGNGRHDPPLLFY